jgi:hypothetical protein
MSPNRITHSRQPVGVGVPLVPRGDSDAPQARRLCAVPLIAHCDSAARRRRRPSPAAQFRPEGRDDHGVAEFQNERLRGKSREQLIDELGDPVAQPGSIVWEMYRAAIDAKIGAASGDRGAPDRGVNAPRRSCS